MAVQITKIKTNKCIRKIKEIIKKNQIIKMSKRINNNYNNLKIRNNIRKGIKIKEIVKITVMIVKNKMGNNKKMERIN
jgi:hypothetical protein